MKKLLTLAAGASVALLGGGTGLAQAATFEGSCSVTGVATFGKPLTSTSQENTYDFRSGPPDENTADNTKCSGKLNGQQVSNVPVLATVAGPGMLSCASGRSTNPGQGALTFPDGTTFPFSFTFTSTLTEVDFQVTGNQGGRASGHASFLNYAPNDAPFECEGIDTNGDGAKGLTKLGFDATTTTSQALVGSAPGTGGGTTGGGGGSTGTPGETPGSTTPQEQRTTSGTTKSKCSKIKNRKKRAACVKRARCNKLKTKKRRTACLKKLKTRTRR